MVKHNIPITLLFGQGWEDRIGMASIELTKIPKLIDFHFEPGFIQNPDGSLELIEISLVPNMANKGNNSHKKEKKKPKKNKKK